MRSLLLLSVLVTTFLPGAFAQIINNTATSKVITESGAKLDGSYTIQNMNGEASSPLLFLSWLCQASLESGPVWHGAPDQTVVGIAFQKEYATVNLSWHGVHGRSGNAYGDFEGVALSGAGKCGAAQYQDGRDQKFVAYYCDFTGQTTHTSAKLLFSAVACGHSQKALSLAEQIGKAGKKEDYKFKKANPNPAPSQKSPKKSSAHVNTQHHPQSQLSHRGHPGGHNGGYDRKKRKSHSGHDGRTSHRGHGGRRRGRGGNRGHGHNSRHRHNSGHPHGHLAKRATSVSPQGPVSSNGVIATGSGNPKYSASGASERAGSAAGGHGPQSEAKETQTGAHLQQESKGRNPQSGESKDGSDDDVERGLQAGASETICFVGQDHLSDMQTGAVTTIPALGFGHVPALLYARFSPEDQKFWFKVTKAKEVD